MSDAYTQKEFKTIKRDQYQIQKESYACVSDTHICRSLFVCLTHIQKETKNRSMSNTKRDICMCVRDRYMYISLCIIDTYIIKETKNTKRDQCQMQKETYVCVRDM